MVVWDATTATVTARTSTTGTSSGDAFAGALTIAGVRNFFALNFPPGDVFVAIAVVVGAAGLVLELGRKRLRP